MSTYIKASGLNNWDKYRYKQNNAVVKRGKYNNQSYDKAFTNANSDLNNIIWDNNGTEQHGFNNALDFQKWFNTMYGNEVGYIREDGKFGNETANALNMAKTFKYGLKQTPVSFDNHSFNTTQTYNTPELDTTSPVITQPGLNQVNRAIVRQGLSNQTGKLLGNGYYDGITDVDQLRAALRSPNKDLFITDLATKLKNRGLDINNDEDWEKYLMKTGIKGHIGARDRRRIRLDYNNDNMKYQNGGQLNQEQQIKEAFAKFCKDNKLQPNEESWKLFQQYLEKAQQEQVREAKFGAKLNYIKQLTGECPEGTEKYYFKAGGKICAACRGIKTGAEGMEMPNNNQKAISKTVASMKQKSGKTTVVPAYTKQDDNRMSQLATKQANKTITSSELQELNSLRKKFNSQPKNIQNKFAVEEGKKGCKLANGGTIDLIKLRTLLHLNK